MTTITAKTTSTTVAISPIGGRTTKPNSDDCSTTVSGAVQRRPEIGDQVIDTFDAHREAHERRIDLEL